jgi:putative DNA primase/helicase
MPSEPGVPVLANQLDQDPLLFNCANGTLDLRTGQLRAHRREDLLTKLAPVTYDPNAQCPRWLKFLDWAMRGNASLVGYLQRVTGYCLTGDVGEQSLWFFHGAGANGKSTFLGVVLELLGDYGLQTVSDLLMAKKNESHPTERADLFGKRFAAAIEAEEGKRIAESLMKQMTGGDRIRARKLFKDFFEFLPSHKIVLAANHKPEVRGTDHAVWRRIKLVPWNATIAEADKDRDLPQKLKTELPGILNWALRGCLDWQENGMDEPKEVKEATAEYRKEQDSVEHFLTSCCHVDPKDPAVKVQGRTLWQLYVDWSGANDLSEKAFNAILRQKGHFGKPGHGNRFYWHGIGVSSTTDWT